VRDPGFDPFRNQRQALCRQYFDQCDGRAGERLMALIMAQLDAA
jgi:hypothetical protein